MTPESQTTSMVRYIEKNCSEAEDLCKVTIPQEISELEKLWKDVEEQNVFNQTNNHEPTPSPGAANQGADKAGIDTGAGSLKRKSQSRRNTQDSEDEPKAKKTRRERSPRSEPPESNPDKEAPHCPSHGMILTQMTTSFKPYLKRGLHIASSLSQWISVLGPGYLDNSVLEGCHNAVMDRINQLDSHCIRVMDSITALHHQRATLMSELHKQPAVTEYRAALTAVEENYVIRLSRDILLLKYCYAVLYDSLSKNISQLKNQSRYQEVMMPF